MRTDALFFDLDDTLIDTKKRHFNIVKDFINIHNKELDFDEYLGMRKTNSWSNKQIIKQCFELNEEEFSLFWMRNIESPEYLKYDSQIVNYELLKNLKAKGIYDFILLSLRSNPESAEQQFSKFEFSSLFDEYYFVQHSALNPKIDKLKYYKYLYGDIVFISDSQDDYNAATVAGVNFIGVQSGIYHLSCDINFENINAFLIYKNDS